MIIKICGITDVVDALRAVECGANALGFNFYRGSPRFIQPDQALQIMAQLPPHVLSVGVVVGRDDAQLAPTSALQIHGLRSEGDVPATPRRIFVAVSPATLDHFPNHEVIVDTSWGSGLKANWSELAKIKRPYILSGGLTPENVAEAIAMLHPAGIDVCSGVELVPGRKDPRKLRRFLQEVTRVSA